MSSAQNSLLDSHRDDWGHLRHSLLPPAVSTSRELELEAELRLEPDTWMWVASIPKCLLAAASNTCLMLIFTCYLCLLIAATTENPAYLKKKKKSRVIKFESSVETVNAGLLFHRAGKCPLTPVLLLRLRWVLWGIVWNASGRRSWEALEVLSDRAPSGLSAGAAVCLCI